MGETRRSFLHKAAVAGAAGAFGVTVPGPWREVLGANERVNIGVVGINGRGGGHIGDLLKIPGVQVTHLIDVDTRTWGKRVASIQKAAGNTPKTFQDLRKALEDKDLDAITIATTNHWHSLQTIWACQAGKDVYVEKPCSHNVFEGRKCVEAARKYGRMVQHGTQQRSGNAWQTARDIAAGKFGRLLVVRGGSYRVRAGIGFKQAMTPPPEVDFDIWLGPAPLQPYHENLVHYNWHWFWDTGSGDIGNNGVHAMDATRWMIPNGTLPKAVFSLGGRFLYNDQGVTPNLQIAVFDYGDVTMIFEVSEFKAVAGGRPSRVFDTTKVPSDPIRIVTPPDVLDPTGPRGPGAGPFGNFIECVRSRRPQDLNAHILEAHYSSALCHLANISYRLGQDVSFAETPKELGTNEEVLKSYAWFKDGLKSLGVELDKTTYRVGKPLKFDPEKEKFIGDAEADKMLTREYRKPFVVPDVV